MAARARREKRHAAAMQGSCALQRRSGFGGDSASAERSSNKRPRDIAQRVSLCSFAVAFVTAQRRPPTPHPSSTGAQLHHLLRSLSASGSAHFSLASHPLAASR